MSHEGVVTACRTAGDRPVRFVYCDDGACLRGEAVQVERRADRMRAGAGLTVAMPARNGLDRLQPVEGMGPVGQP